MTSTAARLPEVLNRGELVSSESLPNEILAFIFMLGQRMSRLTSPHSCVGSDEESAGTAAEATSSTSSPGLKFEVTVSHVSSHWRSVAVHQPFLWNDIHVTLHTSLDELAAYLERSRDCLLNLRLNLGHTDVGHHGMEMLIMHARRWRKLSTETDVEVRKDTFLAHLHHLNAPNLIHVSMVVNAHLHLELMPSNINDPFTQIFVGGAPILSFVRLGCHAMSFFRPPLANMTTLHLDQTAHLPVSYTHFRRVVTASPLLANLSIYGDMIGTDTWPIAASIEMPALRSLRICGVAGFVYCGLLLNISAPGLESLVLKKVFANDLDELWESPQMPKFPILYSLTLCDFECTESTYKRMFRAFPTITNFTSSHSTSRTPKVLGLIGRKEQGLESAIPLKVQPPWPELHTLSLLLDFDDEASIVSMVNSRIQLEHPITRIRFETSTRSRNLQTQHFGKWLREHVKVEMFHGPDPWPVELPYFDEDDVLFW